MLAILTILILVGLLEPSEQTSNRRRPPQEPEITLFPCKNCHHRERARAYRSTYLTETHAKVEDTYRKDLDLKEHDMPISNQKIVLGHPEMVLQME